MTELQCYDETLILCGGNGSFTWKINGISISICPYVRGESFRSRNFFVKECDLPWCLEFYPEGTENELGGLMTVHLCPNKAMKNFFVKCELFLIDASGQKISQCKSSTWRSVFSDNPMPLASLRELLRKKDQLLPNDTLTLHIDFSYVQQIDRAHAMALSLELKAASVAKQKSFASGFARLLQDKENAEVDLIVGNDKISAHRLVLMCRSPVFASMFGRNMIEDRVAIEDVEFDVLCELVSFLYTDDVNFRDRDLTFALKLFAAAVKYDIALLKALCALYLARNISLETVSIITYAATVCDQKLLRVSCEKFCQQHKIFVNLEKYRKCPNNCIWNCKCLQSPE